MFLRHLLNGDWIFDGLVDGDFIPDGLGGWTQYRSNMPRFRTVRNSPNTNSVSLSRVIDGSDLEDLSDFIRKVIRDVDEDSKHSEHREKRCKCDKCASGPNVHADRKPKIDRKVLIQNQEVSDQDIHVQKPDTSHEILKPEEPKRRFHVELDEDELNALKVVFGSKALRTLVESAS